MNIYKYLWFLGDKPKDGKVTIQPSNKTIEVKNNQSILSAARSGLIGLMIVNLEAALHESAIN